MGDLDPKDPATQIAAVQILLDAVAKQDWDTVEKLCDLFNKQPS